MFLHYEKQVLEKMTFEKLVINTDCGKITLKYIFTNKSVKGNFLVDINYYSVKNVTTLKTSKFVEYMCSPTSIPSIYNPSIWYLYLKIFFKLKD